MDISDVFVLEDLSILNEIMLMSCVRKGREDFAVENLISALSQMALFGARNIDWRDNGKYLLHNRPSGGASRSFSQVSI
jgi:hypothetical protein